MSKEKRKIDQLYQRVNQLEGKQNSFENYTNRRFNKVESKVNKLETEFTDIQLKLTSIQIMQIVQLIQEKFPPGSERDKYRYEDIGNMYGVSASTISRIAAQNGVSRRK